MPSNSIWFAGRSMHVSLGVYMYFLVLLAATFNQPSLALLDTYKSTSSSLQRVTVFEDTGDVYVSGTNVLLQFSQNLELKKNMSTGPVEDNDQCLPAPVTCQTPRIPTNNNAQILEVGDNLLVCGTARQGLCTVHSLADITSSHDMEPKNILNFLGSKNGTFAFFGDPPDLPTLNLRRVLYTGVTYDNRPINLAPKVFSTRTIVRNGDTYNADYLFSNDDMHQYSAIDASSDVKRQYIIRTVFGFELRNFVYFLTVQKSTINSNIFHTRLARVCRDSPHYVNYMQIPLVCKKSVRIFRIAMAAWVHKVTDATSAQQLGVQGQESMLYVTFGRSHDGSSDPDPGLGSAVCVYRMRHIREEFIKQLRDCYQGKGTWLHWVTGISWSQNCKRKRDIVREIVDDDSFCYDDSLSPNSAVTGSYPIEQIANYTVSNHLLTTIAVATHLNTTITVLGRDDGLIMKLLSHKLIDGPYATYNLSGDANISVEKDVAFDKITKNLYLLTGKKVHKFSLDSCEIHQTCGECIQSRDPLPCGWCGDKCTVQHDPGCRKSWFNDRCMPAIDYVTPLTGPTSGGTSITIRGSNFGSNYPDAHVSVSLKELDCSISLRNMSRIICSTTETMSESEDSSVVKVSVRDHSRKEVDYNIEGETVSTQIFKYKKPELNKFSPLMGPSSGGTLLTISGHNLNIGSRIVVTAAYMGCNIMERTGQKIVCVTSSDGQSTKRRRRRGLSPHPVGKVQVDIDNTELFSDEDFTYMEDPVITGITPKRSFLSGGVKVTVTGKNFHVIQHPRLGITLNGERFNTSLESCVVAEGGESMVCNSSNIISIVKGPVDNSKPQQVQLWFVMDAVQSVLHLDSAELSQFSYYPDPFFHKFGNDHNLHLFDIGTDVLQLRGENLLLGYSMSDIRVRIGNTICNITARSAEKVQCQPGNKPTDVSSNEPRRKVEVEVGYLSYDIGYLQFISTVVVKAPIVTIIIILILVIMAIILLLIIMRWKRIGPFADKSDLPVNYTPGQEVTSIDEYDTGRMYYLRNDYESARQDGTMLQSTMSVEEAVEGTVLNAYGQDDEIILLLREQKMLIDRDCLQLGDVIGQGHFGCVYKGDLLDAEQNQERKVAVKTLHQEDPREIDVKGFLYEALIMKDFDHPNILTLVGICLGKDKMPLVVLPFMKHGDLLTFVRDVNNNPTVKDLIMFAVDIAMGMQYLKDKRVVHRDLAARNCMLDDSTVKVADFGLSRDIYERDYYSSDNKKTKLPVKWMSMESLEKGTYNSKTDVWSFGVVLWELMTRGVNPYPEVDNWDVIRYLRKGRRMPQPTYCPDALYHIMSHCWVEDPDARPTFEALTTEITEMVTILEQDMQQGRLKTNISNTYVNVNDYHYEPKTETDV